MSPRCLARMSWMMLVYCAGGVGLADELGAAEPVTLPVTRDTWVSGVGDEAKANLGQAAGLKLKSHQEFTLVDCDVESLRGRIVTGAKLHVHLRGNERLHRVTVSTLSTPFVEGTRGSYEPEDGASCFLAARWPDGPWAYPGSDITAACLGQGGTVWFMSDATEPTADGWQTIAVHPSVIQARIAGVSSGFVVFDDTGSEWTRDGDKFNLRLFPNRFIDSKDSRRAVAPYFTVELGAKDTTPPGKVVSLSVSANHHRGELTISWKVPGDSGAGVIGWRATLDGRGLPQWLLPAAAAAGETVACVVRSEDLAGWDISKAAISIAAVDGAGNVGPATGIEERTVRTFVERSAKVIASVDRAVQKHAEKAPVPFDVPATTPLPKIGSAEVAVIDGLDKLNLTTGELIPAQSPAYLHGNHLWRCDPALIRFQAAGGETVSFQLVVKGTVTRLKPSIVWKGKKVGPGISAEFFQVQSVGSNAGRIADPCVPWPAAGGDLPAASDTATSGQWSQLLCDVFVSKKTPAGVHDGELVLESTNGRMVLPIELTVWGFSVPDSLSFLPEMNCYDLPGNAVDYYRLGHAHRTVLNRVPYYHNGNVAEGMAPEWNGKTFDWSKWDKRFGPMFDGSAFAGLPRSKEPIECFYLPLFENWPTPMEGNYNGSYWADSAFPEQYEKTFVSASKQFAEHFTSKGWTKTRFQFYLNGKNNFKERGWSRGTCPWLLDEPANFQDFWALRWYGAAFHRGVSQAAASAKDRKNFSQMLFRADISRPQWQRDSLDGLLDYNVIAGGAFRQYRRMALDRQRHNGDMIVDYGGTARVEETAVQPAAWCVDSWTLGSDGVLPWQTIGTAESWKTADELSLFYPGEEVGLKTPVAALRLKAYRRGQQDVEYLALLTSHLRLGRHEVAQWVRHDLKLAGQAEGTGFVGGEDAGRISYAELRPQALWSMRMRVAAALHHSARMNDQNSRLADVPRGNPPRDPSRLPVRLVK